MSSSTILIFGSKIFLEILNEIKFFSTFKIKYYQNQNLCIEDAKKQNHLAIFFAIDLDNTFYENIKESNFPIIIIGKSKSLKKKLLNPLIEELKTPFTLIDLEKKITSLIAKNEFKKNSLIKLNEYIIDKNERKIKKNNLELQLSEKEVNFLILFSKNKKPIGRNLVLKHVWKYSVTSETHTVETHIHRLRKKIFEKFGDNNFIKNNNKGYFI